MEQGKKRTGVSRSTLRAEEQEYINSYKMMQLILERRGDPNAQTNSGKTALHLAVAANDFGVIKLLREHGADMTIKDRWDQEVLHIAFLTPEEKDLYLRDLFRDEDPRFDGNE